MWRTQAGQVGCLLSEEKLAELLRAKDVFKDATEAHLPRDGASLVDRKKLKTQKN